MTQIHTDKNAWEESEREAVSSCALRLISRYQCSSVCICGSIDFLFSVTSGASSTWSPPSYCLCGKRRYFLGVLPEHSMTGRLGYFGNAGSPADRSHRKKIEPRADSIRRACRQSAQRPARERSLEIWFSSSIHAIHEGYCIAGTPQGTW